MKFNSSKPEGVFGMTTLECISTNRNYNRVSWKLNCNAFALNIITLPSSYSTYIRIHFDTILLFGKSKSFTCFHFQVKDSGLHARI